MIGMEALFSERELASLLALLSKKDFACDKKDAGSHEPASFFACRYSIINNPVQTEDNLRAR